MLNILLIGDGSSQTCQTQELLKKAGYPAQTIVDGHDNSSLLNALAASNPNIILMVRSIDGKKYISPKIMQALRHINSGIQIIIVSKGNDPEARRIAIDWDYYWMINLDDSPEVIARLFKKVEKKKPLLTTRWRRSYYDALAYLIKGSSSAPFPGRHDGFLRDLGSMEYYQVIILRVLPKYIIGHKPPKESSSIKGFSILCSHIEQMQNTVFCRDNLDAVICLMGSIGEINQSKTHLSGFLRDMKYFNATVSPVMSWIAVGTLVDSIERLAESYDSAHKVIMNRFYLPAFSIVDVPALLYTPETPEAIYFLDTIYSLTTAAEVMDDQKILHILNKLKENCKTLPYLSGDSLFSIYRKLISTICGVIDHANSGSLPAPAGLEFETMLSEFDFFCTMDDMFSFLEHCFMRVIEHIQKADYLSLPLVITKAKEYIRAYYNMPLTLREISEYVHMSDNYFSDFFSKHVGMTFKQYQTNLRIKHAKGLLLNENNSLEFIAEEVGYSDVKYFLRVFKKNTGITPGAYRAKFFLESHKS